MRTVGPRTFTVDATTAVPDPAQGSSGNPSAACQIQNSSPYQINVNAGAGSLSLQPFTAQTVEISGQPITLDPIGGTGSGTCTMTLAFLLGTPAGTGIQIEGPQGGGGEWIEAPPMTDGPLTAAAIAAAISGGFVTTGDVVDFLDAGSYLLISQGAGALPTATIEVDNLQRSYAALLFAFTPNPTGELFCAEAEIVGPNSPATLWSGAFMAQPALSQMQGIIPVGNEVGDNLFFTVYGLVASGSGEYTLFGLTSCPINVRPDVRAYPVGAIGVMNNTATAGTVTLVGALTNARVLLKSASSLITQSGTGSWVALLGTMNGTSAIQVLGAMANGTESIDVEEGILFDADSDLDLLVTGGSITGHRTSIIYDVVPA